MSTIYFVSDKRYRFLSNFFTSMIIREDNKGIWYFPTAEHYYQWFKNSNSLHKKRIIEAKTPGQAKYLGSYKGMSEIGVPLRKDWEDIKDKVMLKVLREKFKQNPVLAQMLVDTRNCKLIEDTYWHDQYWGICTCNKCKGEGENRLGILLNRVRKEFIKGNLQCFLADTSPKFDPDF